MSLAACEARLRQAICQVAPLAGASRLEETLKVQSFRSVLPAGHQMRTDARMMAAAGLIAATHLEVWECFGS